MAKVREVLFDLMRKLGMTKIFGNVGSTEEPMLQNFPADFEYILSLLDLRIEARESLNVSVMTFTIFSLARSGYS